MSHDHSHSHAHATSDNIRVAFFINLAFALLEVFGGLWTNSLAILSDALHDLGDSVSLGLSWFLERYSQRSEDERYSYGYRRYSLLGALINAIILIVGSIGIMAEAIPRLMNPEPTNAPGMLLFALGGIAVNGFAVLRLRHEKSMNAQVVAWHLLEDVYGWVAVLLVSVVLWISDFYILDPILSVLVTAYILFNVFRNLRKTVSLFLQAVPPEVNLAAIEGGIHAIDKVQSTHHAHVWSLDGEHHVLTMHVVVDGDTTRDQMVQIKCDVNDLIDAHDFVHTTIEIEFEDEECRMKEPHSH